ncbi:MAG: hypothetical protein ACI80V_002412 [Rhodothermales bacterium]|jgi:hypothetical protein
MSAPNLTTGRGGVAASYSDGQLARAIRYGIDSEGKTLIFMPTAEHTWWPDEDLLALLSYIRSVRPVDREVAPTSVGLLGKVLSRFGVMELESAKAINNVPDGQAPAPEPTARYGAFLAIGCKGCHGDGFSGGKIPGAPAILATPANLTPHESGLLAWTIDDFINLLETGARPDGRLLDPFLPIQSLKAMNETEKTALWAYLRTLEPTEFGQR